MNLASALLHGAVLFALVLTPLGAGAQPSSGDDDVVGIEEIIVKARRRAESLQETPLAVSAFSAESLDNAGVSDLGGLKNLVPNLNLNVGDASNAIIYVRGIGQRDSLSFADPGVAVYLDDIYLGRAQGSFLEVLDVDHIEVLRGPQGTLYGRNTIGGAVKYLSATPEQEFSGRISGGGGVVIRCAMCGGCSTFRSAMRSRRASTSACDNATGSPPILQTETTTATRSS